MLRKIGVRYTHEYTARSPPLRPTFLLDCLLDRNRTRPWSPRSALFPCAGCNFFCSSILLPQQNNAAQSSIGTYGDRRNLLGQEERYSLLLGNSPSPTGTRCNSQLINLMRSAYRESKIRFKWNSIRSNWPHCRRKTFRCNSGCDPRNSKRNLVSSL